MRKLREVIRQQSRTLFVLAAIGLVWGVNAFLIVDIADVQHDSTLPQRLFSRHGKPKPTAGAPQVEKSPQASHQEVQPKPEIKPDYHMPEPADGTIPVINRIPTEKKVVFLTIDDGLEKTPDAPRLLEKYHIKAPMFLNDVYVKEKPSYFRSLMLEQGMVVGAHTVDHTDLTTLGYEEQVNEICGNAAHLEEWLGERPSLFRPPYGSYNDSVVQAAGACGMRAVVMWSAKANGGSMQYQDGHAGLVAGDIVLMHFRPEFAADFKAFIDAAKTAGLQPENLDDWLQPAEVLPEGQQI